MIVGGTLASVQRRLHVPAAQAVGGDLREEYRVQARIEVVHRRLGAATASAKILNGMESYKK